MGIEQFDFSFFFNHSIHASISNKSSLIELSNDFAVPIQTHSNNIKFVKKGGIYEDVDGLISSKKYQVPLSIKVADCVPIYLYDIKKECYGLIHSGWRGTRNKIISKALNVFIKEIGSNSKDIFIVIGPHIQRCCYEIDWDVAQYFSYVYKKNNKWLLDLNKEIKSDILKFDIPIGQIYTSNICTYESMICESFRRDGLKSKRMVGIIK